MRAVVTTAFGGPEVLAVRTRPRPVPAAGQVRIAVHAAGVNFADVMTRLGNYPHSTPLPYVGGFEVAGVVAEAAPDVRGPAVGDRVIAVTRQGGYAEEVCVNRTDTIPLPASMSFAKGAAVPIAYATAWAGLRTYGNVQPGERVLVLAAAGGVGVAATQLAHAVGAEVYGAASPGKLEAVRGLGADVTVDYTRPHWEEELPPFDLVLDPLGADSFARSYGMLRPGGRLVPFGAISEFDGGRRDAADPGSDFRVLSGLSTAHQLVDSKTVIGLDLRVLWDDRDTLQPWLAPLLPMLHDGTIAPLVSEILPFTEAAAAHDALVERRNIGKVVLVP
jgi:NADPH:quinone reductase-like Zn-dependent oxidoreductase